MKIEFLQKDYGLPLVAVSLPGAPAVIFGFVDLLDNAREIVRVLEAHLTLLAADKNGLDTGPKSTPSK